MLCFKKKVDIGYIGLQYKLKYCTMAQWLKDQPSAGASLPLPLGPGQTIFFFSLVSTLRCSLAPILEMLGSVWCEGRLGHQMSPTKGSIMKHSKVIKTSNNWAKPKAKPTTAQYWLSCFCIIVKSRGSAPGQSPNICKQLYNPRGLPTWVAPPTQWGPLEKTPPASCSKDGGGIFEDLRSQRNEVWNRTAKGTKPERNSPTAAPHSTKPPTAEPRSHGPNAPRNPLHPASSQQLCRGSGSASSLSMGNYEKIDEHWTRCHSESWLWSMIRLENLGTIASFLHLQSAIRTLPLGRKPQPPRNGLYEPLTALEQQSLHVGLLVGHGSSP